MGEMRSHRCRTALAVEIGVRLGVSRNIIVAEEEFTGLGSGGSGSEGITDGGERLIERPIDAVNGCGCASPSYLLVPKTDHQRENTYSSE